MASASTTRSVPDPAIVSHTRDLLAMADAPYTDDTRLFARLIGASLARSGTAMLGLSRQALTALCARHFPGASPASLQPDAATIPIHADTERAFVEALRALLLEHATGSGAREGTRCLASIIATACLRPDHLWKDLGLDGREAVSEMLERHFRTLAARNTGEMRWKKFLAFELALRQGTAPGPAPGCPGCEDFRFCYPTVTK
jgi:nitrogen fixation protein NifQ